MQPWHLHKNNQWHRTPCCFKRRDIHFPAQLWRCIKRYYRWYCFYQGLCSCWKKSDQKNC